MTVRFAEDDFLGGGCHLLGRIGFSTGHDQPVGAVGTVVVPVCAGRGGGTEHCLGVQLAAGAVACIACPAFKIGIGDSQHDFVPEGVLEGGAVGPFVARSTIVSRRQIALIITDVHGGASAELLHVVDATNGAGLVAGFGEGGEEHGGQNRDDGDDDKQLYQGEVTRSLHGMILPNRMCFSSIITINFY